MQTCSLANVPQKNSQTVLQLQKRKKKVLEKRKREWKETNARKSYLQLDEHYCIVNALALLQTNNGNSFKPNCSVISVHLMLLLLFWLQLLLLVFLLSAYFRLSLSQSKSAMKSFNNKNHVVIAVVTYIYKCIVVCASVSN